MSNSLPGTDPATNTRFADLGNGTYSEIMSDQVQLFYDPATGACRATFNCKTYVDIGGQYHVLGGEMQILQVDFSEKIVTCYGEGVSDPITGADLSGVTVAGVMIMIKAALDKEWNERSARIAKAIADAAAAAAAAEAAAAADAAAASGTTASGTTSSGTASSGMSPTG